MIYARAITEVLELGGDITNGKEVMNRIFNRSYHSIQGFDVHIDANGDAEGNYTVICLQDEIGFKNNIAKMSMQPVGYFVSTTSSIPVCLFYIFIFYVTSVYFP